MKHFKKVFICPKCNSDENEVKNYCPPKEEVKDKLGGFYGPEYPWDFEEWWRECLKCGYKDYDYES